jgi:excisionase family DNA binding protein
MQEISVIGDYLSAEQLAQQLHISLRTLQRWTERGKGPSVTVVGRTVYYRRQAINDWLLSREGTRRTRQSHHIEIIPPQRNARQRNARRAAK